MGHEQRRHAGRVQDLRDLLAQAVAQRCVEVGERLVEEHEVRRRRERASERDALLLAARQLVHRPPLRARQADELERLADPPGIGLAAQAVADVAGHVHVRKEGVVLEDHPDPALLSRHEAVGTRHDLAADDDLARIGPFEAGDQA